MMAVAKLYFDSDETCPDLPGFITGEVHPADAWAFLAEIVVDNEAQGQGYGKKLVEAFENWARDKGVTVIQGMALPSAVGFWEKLGYGVSEDDDDGYFVITKSIWLPPAPS